MEGDIHNSIGDLSGHNSFKPKQITSSIGFLEKVSFLWQVSSCKSQRLSEECSKIGQVFILHKSYCFASFALRITLKIP